MWKPGFLGELRRFTRASRRVAGNVLFWARTGTVRNYWEERHRRFASSLSAVGHAQLSEAENRSDYEVKRQMLSASLRFCLGPSEPGRQALDVGCGTGQMFPVLRSLDFAITGIDFSIAAIKQARASFPNSKFLVADLSGFALRQRFHLILIFDVLFHILDDDKWEAALDMLLYHLERDGCIVIQEHFVESKGYVGTRQHVHHRLREAYEAWAKKKGLSVAYERTYTLPGQKTHKNLLVLKKEMLDGSSL